MKLGKRTARKNMMVKEEQNLIIMVGLPRSGKGTWVKQNCGDAVVISSDWIREHILGETYSYSGSANAIVWTIMDATLRIVLGQGKNAILDGCNLTKATRSYYVDIARKYKAKVIMMVINTPLNECLKRNAMTSNHKLPGEDLVKMNKSFQWPSLDECDLVEQLFPPEEKASTHD